MKAIKNASLFILTFATLTTCFTAQAELKHRYSFDGSAGGTAVTDTAGTSNGTLEGGAVLSGTGEVTLDGAAGYVNLPNGIISSLTNITIEAWVNWNGGGNWQRLFDFGTSSAGEDMQGTGQAFFFLTPQSGFAGTPMLLGKAGEPDLTAATLPSGQQVQVTVIYAPSSNFTRIFVNGQQIASRGATTPLSAVNDLNNWLGRSQFATDPYFSGSITEFRVFDKALSKIEVALDTQAGPDQLGGSDPGTVQSVALNIQTNMFLGNSQQASATATFQNLTNFDLTGDPEAVYSSTNTSIVNVSASGLVEAVGEGDAWVMVDYRGVQDSLMVTVSLPPSVTPDIRHRYSFGENFGETNAMDSVGGADGTIEGNSLFGGDGNVYLDGLNSYVDLPNDILSNYTSVTIEAWINWNGGGEFQRLFDFGTSDAGEGSQGTGLNFIYFTPSGGAAPGTALLGVAGQADTVGSVAVGAGVPAYVAVVYNPVNNFSRVYLDGQLIGSGVASVPLSSIVDVNNWLGRSQFSVDPYFSGTISEFRVYQGVLSSESIVFNAAAGPDLLVTDPGALQSIALQVPSQLVTLGSTPMNATVLATYENIANVDVTSFSGVTFETSNPGVVSVNEQGEIDATGQGMATVTARFQGEESNLPITVSLPSGYTVPMMIHRYTFNEAPGSTTVEDSVGTADGTPMGGATFNGSGMLTLNGSTAFVDLPNGLVSGLQNVTVEAWVNWTGGYWERLFDFGTSDAGEGMQGAGQGFFFLCPLGGPAPGGLFLGFGGNDVQAPVTLPSGQLVHVAVSYNFAAGATRLYIDGERVMVGPASVALSTVQDLNDWLGQSQFAADGNFTGSLDEFRIYDGALLDAAVAASYAAGPVPGIEKPSLSVSLNGNMLTITWPTNGTSLFQLTSSGLIGAGQNWTNVNVMRDQSGGNYSITVPILAGKQFFRLEQ